jgi:hypothetical protein
MSSAAASPASAPAGTIKTASPASARVLLALVIVAAVAAGLLATGPEPAAHAADAAGVDLTRLLRAMAVLKSAMAAGAAAAVLWRLGAAVSWPWLGAYAAACAAMAAGPGLIWGMAHVGLGAALLHGGLFATCLLLWRDRAVGVRLSAIVAARRAALATRRP